MSLKKNGEIEEIMQKIKDFIEKLMKTLYEGMNNMVN